MKADARTTTAVKAVLAQLMAAYSQRDLKAILSLHAKDKGLVSIGTGGDELTLGYADARKMWERDFAQSGWTSSAWEWVNVYAKGLVAWVAGELVIKAKVGKEKVTVPIRFTAVLEKRGEKWLFVQTHSSVSDPRQPKGHAFPKR